MATNSNNARDRQAFESFIESHGADRTRWPVAQRHRFAVLLSSDADARRLLAEASALDRLLDMAPLVHPERETALADRIVRLAREQEPGMADTPVPRWTGTILRPHGAGRGQPARSRVEQFRAPAAALLAASLMLGIFAGSTEFVRPGIDQVAVTLGLSEDESELALNTDPIASGEDFL